MKLKQPMTAAAALMIVAGATALAQTSTTEQNAPVREGDPVLVPEADRGDPVETVPTLAGEAAVIRALDKFTGELATLEASVDGSAEFQRMRIDVKACYARVSARKSEATAFLQIFDGKDEPPTQVFSGWMFSASPALSALDHPRYDFWVASCKTS